MADKTMGAQDFLMFQTLLNQLGPYATKTNQALYGMFPKTASAAAGLPTNFIGPLSKAQLAKGAMGVSTMGATRFPLVSGGLQALSGDPIGGIGTAGGGFIGAKLGAKAGAPFALATGGLSIPIGAVLGGLIGGGIGQSTTRGLAGIDVNNPLTGPDISLAGIPLSQYAKTKKSLERATELEKKRYQELAPLYEKARNQQMARDMIGSQMGLASTMLGSVYGR